MRSIREKLQKKFYIKMTTTRILALGFFIGILVGSVLLSLPVASKSGEATPYADSLFVATSTLCVTGLMPMVTASHWSLFGQVVLVLLMQLGGLGIVTFTTLVLLLIGKRITLENRLLIQNAYSLDSTRGVVRLTVRIVKGTLLVEAVGALFYAAAFIPRYGLWQGIWMSVFHAVSAFCNAGIDIIGAESLMAFRDNVLVNVTTMLLVTLGGIGFPVWWDVIRVARGMVGKDRDIHPRDAFRKTMLYTKIALTATAVLTVAGTLLILVFEYHNPATIGELPFGRKLMASLFESVTFRTAGFQTFPQTELTEASCILALVFMFIGGSPSGTAGGVKTVTVTVLFLSMLAAVRGDNEVRAFGRRISDNYVRRCVAIVVISIACLLVVATLLCVTEEADFLDVMFETFSALTTAGMSRGMTPSVSFYGRIVLIFAMYIGRLGPITLALAFNAKPYEGKKSYPDGKVIIG